MAPDRTAKREFDGAYARLVVVAYRSARRFSVSTGRLVDAEDLAADAMALLFTHWERAKRTHLEGWVVNAVNNLGRNALRRERRRGRACPAAEVDTVSRDHAESVTTAKLIRQALHDLPRRQRQVAELRFLHGLTVRDTASVLGISEGAVKGYWSTARRRLQEQIDFTPDRAGIGHLEGDLR